jgi:putative redox protein
MRAMKAVARRTNGRFEHEIEVRSHSVAADEPEEHGGEDTGPNPQELLAASLASCTAITMEMYAARKGWDLGPVEVETEYTPAERGAPTRFNLVIRLPADLTDEQVDKLRVIAAKCPVHRTLDGEVMFDESFERVERVES